MKLNQVRMHPVKTKVVRAIEGWLVDRLGPNDLPAVVFTRNNRDAQRFTLPDRASDGHARTLPIHPDAGSNANGRSVRQVVRLLRQ